MTIAPPTAALAADGLRVRADGSVEATHGWRGPRSVDPETRERISAALKGRPKPPETVAKIQAARRLRRAAEDPRKSRPERPETADRPASGVR